MRILRWDAACIDAKAHRFLSTAPAFGARRPLHCAHAYAADADHRVVARLARWRCRRAAAIDRTGLCAPAHAGAPAPARQRAVHAGSDVAGAREFPAPVQRGRGLARSRAFLRAGRTAHAQRADRPRARTRRGQAWRRRGPRHLDRGCGVGVRNAGIAGTGRGAAPARGRGRAHRQDHRADLFRRPQPRRDRARARGVRAHGRSRPAFRPGLAQARTGRLGFVRMSRFAHLQELFEAAVALAPDERKRFVDTACAGDAALRTELEALLAADAQAHDPLAASIARGTAEHFDDGAPWLGRRIGNYRILRELGRGGMGSVFLAERADAEYESRVAIKLIRGFPTPAALERLRRERQLLAGLVHPHIARLLDGGTTDEGQPYLVMEYVDGMPLAQWLDAQEPPLEQRLR